MARQRASSANTQLIGAAVAFFRKLPTVAKVGVLVLLLVGAGVYLLFQLKLPANPKANTTPTTPADPPKVEGGGITAVSDGENEFLFCFWNVENLFDDKDDPRNKIDEVYDQPFADLDSEKLKDELKEDSLEKYHSIEKDGHLYIRKDDRFVSVLRLLKYDRIASALLKMNGGKGPDVIACAEVESVRAAELLRDTLNAKLKAAKADDKLLYPNVLMQNVQGGRDIAPCIISRLGVDVKNVKLIKKPLRILETHLTVNGKDLCVMVAHWTSKLPQVDGGNGEEGREKYANAIYNRFRELNKEHTHADILVCGDFNDTPDSDPIFKNLGAIGDVKKVKPTDKEPYLFNLMHGKDPKQFGTLWYREPLIYDHVCVSPGMLDDKGWSVDTKSIETVTDGLIKKGAKNREPWRFDSPGKQMKDEARGYADHFPVTVKLKVEAAKK